MGPLKPSTTYTLPIGLTGAISLGRERQISLLVYHRDGVEAVPLEAGRTVVVGRDPSCDVAITNPGLSREHACLELRDDEVWVEDLGSTNGTRLNGEKVKEAQVRPGDELLFGSLPASVHVMSSADGQLQGVLGHDPFFEEVEREIVRHRMFGRTFGVLMVRASSRRLPLVRWCAQLQRHVRPIDRIGLYSPSAVEILLPEVTASELADVARTITDDRIAGGPQLLCGTALYPQAATSAGELLEVVRTSAQQARVAQPVIAAPESAAADQMETAHDQQIIVRSPAMQKVFAVVERMTRSAIPVLILGETGTGKEVIARAIHQGSGRSTLPCVNCAAIPEQLIESIMFGHEKGSFTGADRQRRGVFEEADGGSVFLDEIGELSPAAQAALLRVLDTKRITRVGSTREIPVNVRILAATHRNLEAMCEAGTFRRDLLFRINTMTIKIPPLRERVEEIEPLAEAFLREANDANESAVEGFDSEVHELLRRYRWPGNVRELRNVVHRATVLTEGRMVSAEHLPERIRQLDRGSVVQEERTPAPFGSGTVSLTTTPGTEPDLDYKTRIQRYETQLIRAALEQTGWSKTKAAQVLRIPLRTLIYKVQSFGIAKEG